MELGWEKRSGFFDTARNDYSENLLNRYLKAPQLDQLVIWETVRTRLDSMSTGRKRGDATGEILLRIELARLLFSALGTERDELFDAVHLKTRSASGEAETVASKAEEEIERINVELSKAAEKILEQLWRLP